MHVTPIPTNKPIQRFDDTDLVYGTESAKYNAILAEIKARHALGQPILVGTPSVEASEVLHQLLDKEHIAHEVLNAKNHEREAHIIEKAGELNAVTIATNMAGRGTDIKLGEGVRELTDPKGEVKYPDGKKFICPFVKGKPHGIGIYDDGKGKKCEVEFIQGKINKKYKPMKKKM